MHKLISCINLLTYYRISVFYKVFKQTDADRCTYTHTHTHIYMSGIFYKGHYWQSFTQKYFKITLFLKKRTLFCQILQGTAPEYRTLISFGLFLETRETSSDVIAGFTLGYQWLLIFEDRKLGGSLPFRKFQWNCIYK